MDYPSPGELLRRHGLLAKKSFGQHFLGDRAILERIVDACELRPGAWVIEIGPGLGALTARLLGRGAHVLAVERDRDMAQVLRAELGAHERFRLVEEDALTADYAQLAAAAGADPATTGMPLTVVGNLPYNVGTAILGRLLEPAQRRGLGRIVAMLQREVAERLVAGPGSRDYGGLSLGIQLVAEVERVLQVAPGCFVPPPKVRSEVVRLYPQAGTRVAVSDEAAFRRLVQHCFAGRRKQLRGSLRAQAAQLGLSPGDIEPWLAAAGIAGERRAETVSLAEMATLLAELEKRRASAPSVA
jgi:16S rRNA (adenine1518-N6/adenine1519-N6)-dimethyltransferase